MRITRSIVRSIALFSLTVLVIGCGAHRMPPIDPRPVGALKPGTEDPDAGLVGMVSDFNVKVYRVIVVESFPAVARASIGFPSSGQCASIAGKKKEQQQEATEDQRPIRGDGDGCEQDLSGL